MLPNKEGVYLWREYCAANCNTSSPRFWTEEHEIEVYQGPPDGPQGLCVFLGDYGGDAGFYDSHVPVADCGLEFIRFIRDLD